MTEGLIHGDSLVSASLYYTKDHPGNVDFFVSDSANWSLFTVGSAFQAYDPSIDNAGRSSSFVPPTVDDYYVVWSNKAVMDMAQVVTGSVRLYSNNGSVPPVIQLIVDKDAAGASLLDWEDVSGQNVDGYNVYRSTSASDVGSARTEEELQDFLLGTVTVSSYTDPTAASPGSYAQPIPQRAWEQHRCPAPVQPFCPLVIGQGDTGNGDGEAAPEQNQRTFAGVNIGEPQEDPNRQSALRCMMANSCVLLYVVWIVA